jgi:hypothetical protein
MRLIGFVGYSDDELPSVCLGQSDCGLLDGLSAMASAAMLTKERAAYAGCVGTLGIVRNDCEFCLFPPESSKGKEGPKKKLLREPQRPKSS